MLACHDRTQADDEQCFYEDPGYWIDPGPSWRNCDDIGRDDHPDPPEGMMAIGAIVRVFPDEDGTCDLCMPPQFDDQFLDPTKEQAHVTHVRSVEGTEVVDVHRQCVAPPGQTVHLGGGGCWYRASVFIICHDEV